MLGGIEEIASDAISYSIGRGDALVRAGHARRGRAFVVVSGRFRVEIASDGGDRAAALWWLGPGDVFDDTLILTKMHHAVGVVATTPSAVCSLPGDKLHALMLSNPSLAFNWARMLAGRLVQTIEAAHAVAFVPAEERFAAELRRLSVDGKLLASSVEIRRPSDSEMGRSIACNRETVCRMRADFARRGLIVERGGNMVELTQALWEEEKQ